MGGEATRWQPGQSGNVTGRPKDKRTVAAVKEELALKTLEALTPKRLTRIVHRLIDITEDATSAKKDVVAASKVLFGLIKVDGNSSEPLSRGGFKIVIENATLVAPEKVKREPIDVEATVIEAQPTNV